MQRDTMALSNPASGSVVVIGGCNIDHKSQTFGSAVAGTSNPGRSHSSLGGVGRNIAENLARMGTHTTLVTAVGHDADGARLLRYTASAGVDVSRVVRSPSPTGSYTAILDEHGDLVIAVASMGAMTSLGAEVIAACTDIIATARLLVLDCNVPDAALLHAAETARANAAPILVDPVSVAKSSSVKALLDAGLPLHTVTPNCDELSALTGAAVSTNAEIAAAARQLQLAGVKYVWVTLAARGSMLSWEEGGEQRCQWMDACPAALVDVTGAGDAMLAGYAAALVRGSAPTGAVHAGRAAAAITVESDCTVCPSLDFDAVTRRRAACIDHTPAPSRGTFPG